jgi:hypothetical protein
MIKKQLSGKLADLTVDSQATDPADEDAEAAEDDAADEVVWLFLFVCLFV